VSESKWSKFVREMKIFPDFHKPLRQAQVDLGFKRQMHAQEEAKTEAEKRRTGGGARFMSEEFFAKGMEELVYLRYPSSKPNSTTDDNHNGSASDDDNQRNGGSSSSSALKKVLMESAMMMPEVNQKSWNEAKRLAMLAEGRKYSAATRVQSSWRRVTSLDRFRLQLRNAVVLQAHLRRKRCELRYTARKAYLLEDALYRLRWGHALTIQMAFRRFVAARDFKQRVMLRHGGYLQRCEGRRETQRNKRKKREARAMFKRVRTVNGTLTLQEMQGVGVSRWRWRVWRVWRRRKRKCKRRCKRRRRWRQRCCGRRRLWSEAVGVRAREPKDVLVRYP